MFGHLVGSFKKLILVLKVTILRELMFSYANKLTAIVP
jgi:hypothetical protein